LVLEKVVDGDRAGPVHAVIHDVCMSLAAPPGGRERTRVQYEKMLSRQGFRDIRIQTMAGYNYSDAILAKKPF
jgi:hypothetical protein